MPLKIIRDDITKIKCDAIVNAANPSLLGGGGVDGAIHKAAGRKLLEKCSTLGGCRTGEAKLTKGYDLPSKYVIHTVGPIWRGGAAGEEALLRSCYRNSLAIAKDKKCESVAFPLISSGAYGYPKDQALHIAVEEITAFLLNNDMLVYIVVYDRRAYQISEKLFDDISAFIDDNYVALHGAPNIRRSVQAEANGFPGICPAPPLTSALKKEADDEFSDTAENQTASLWEPAVRRPKSAKAPAFPTAVREDLSDTGMIFEAPQDKQSLEDILKQIDESFSEMLLRKIDEKGLTDPECYKKANVDRKLFSKIRGDKSYRPSKTTAIAFCIALELTLTETRDMLMKAGYALSHSNKFDIIIEYFITNQNYNIFEINEALFAFDQSLLGA
ncbi:MAG: O-acetyl-ADP-ribose deacetylase [Clostridiales bacterium]|nr:O-acetyl-ADP-ribose deacetylase [Clostridiales bacterium]